MDGLSRSSSISARHEAPSQVAKKQSIIASKLSEARDSIKASAGRIKENYSKSMSELKSKGPLDTIIHTDSTRIATPTAKLKEFNVMSNIPLDNVKISDTQKKVIGKRIVANKQENRELLIARHQNPETINHKISANKHETEKLKSSLGSASPERKQELTEWIKTNEQELKDLEGALTIADKKMPKEEIQAKINENEKKNKELSSLSNKNHIRYVNVTDEQKKALDEGKFLEIQDHLNNISEVGTTNTVDKLYNEKSLNFQEAHVGEILSKALVYLDPTVLKGQKISLPIGEEMVSYTIDVRQMDNGKLPFITLKPENPDAKAWVVIRGTDPNIIGKSAKNAEAKESSLGSIKADFAKDVSTKSVDEHDFTETFASLGGDVNIAGHSLGALLAQQLAIKSTEDGQNAGKVYAFNSPGVSKETKERFEKLGDFAPEINAFCKKGDFISSAGRKLIGNQYRIEQGDNNPDVAHREMDLNKQHTISNINVEQEESKGVRALMEGSRKYVGRPLAAVILPYFKV